LWASKQTVSPVHIEDYGHQGDESGCFLYILIYRYSILDGGEHPAVPFMVMGEEKLVMARGQAIVIFKLINSPVVL